MMRFVLLSLLLPDFILARLLAMTDINLKRATFVTQPAPGAVANGAAVTEPLEHTADITPRDWDCLFEAVIERLQTAVSEQFASEHGAHAGDTLAAVRASVRECLEALAQLQASIIFDRDRPTLVDPHIAHGKTLLSEAIAQKLARNADTQERTRRERRLLLHDSVLPLPNGSGAVSG